MGQADPRMIRSVVATLDLLAQHGDSLTRKCWASIMAAWCREWSTTTCALPAAVIPLAPDAIRAARADPLVGIDVTLNRWLSTFDA